MANRKQIAATVVAVMIATLSLTTAHASTFDWSYTGAVNYLCTPGCVSTTGTDTGSGTLTTDGVSLVTGITGTWDSVSIVALLPPGSFFANTDFINPLNPPIYFDASGVAMSLSDGVKVIFSQASFETFQPNSNYTTSTGTFSLTPTPLPAALPLFATGLGALGLLGWRRKRKAAATSLAAA
jgi:hypothetical protein